MKSNKLLIALALCTAMQPNLSFGSAVSQEEGPAPKSQSYWQQYAPEFMQRGTRYVSQQATSAYDTVSKWSTKKKLIVAGSIITALAAIYNREQIMQWVSDILSSSQPDPLQIQNLEESLKQVMQDRERARIARDNLSVTKAIGLTYFGIDEQLFWANMEFGEQDKKMWDILKSIGMISPQEEKKVLDQLKKEYKKSFPGAL
jgi:hypothetical protein